VVKCKNVLNKTVISADNEVTAIKLENASVQLAVWRKRDSAVDNETRKKKMRIKNHK